MFICVHFVLPHNIIPFPRNPLHSLEILLRYLDNTKVLRCNAKSALQGNTKILQGKVLRGTQHKHIAGECKNIARNAKVLRCNAESIAGECKSIAGVGVS